MALRSRSVKNLLFWSRSAKGVKVGGRILDCVPYSSTPGWFRYRLNEIPGNKTDY